MYPRDIFASGLAHGAKMDHPFTVIDGGGGNAPVEEAELLECPCCGSRTFVQAFAPVIIGNEIKSTGSAWLCLQCFVEGEVTEFR